MKRITFLDIPQALPCKIQITSPHGRVDENVVGARPKLGVESQVDFNDPGVEFLVHGKPLS